MEKVNLIEIAKLRGGIEILVDFGCLENELLHLIGATTGIHGKSKAEDLKREYAFCDEAIRKLYTDLKSLGITLVVFTDGTKGLLVFSSPYLLLLNDSLGPLLFSDPSDI